MTTLTCPQCQQEFAPHTTTQQYCSERCRRATYRAANAERVREQKRQWMLQHREKQRAGRLQELRQCDAPGCTTLFPAKPSNRLYCSMRCKHAARRQTRAALKPPKPKKPEPEWKITPVPQATLDKVNAWRREQEILSRPVRCFNIECRREFRRQHLRQIYCCAACLAASVGKDLEEECQDRAGQHQETERRQEWEARKVVAVIVPCICGSRKCRGGCRP